MRRSRHTTTSRGRIARGRRPREEVGSRLEELLQSEGEVSGRSQIGEETDLIEIETHGE